MTNIQLYTGSVQRLDDEGQSSAIFKYPVNSPIWLGWDGLNGDAQADRRVHGGPEKAVHHYASENYARLAQRFPAIADQLVAGTIGENVATTGWSEKEVCLGDIFRLGQARVQVSQPRSPCWKIDHRYATKGIAGFIAETGLTGWYYRVLECGEVANDTPFELIDRPAGAVSLAEFWLIWREHRPNLDTLARLSNAPGLTPVWQQKLGDRLNWLRKNAAAPAAAAPSTFHVKPILF